MSIESTRHPGMNLGIAHGRTDDAAEETLFGFWVFMMSDAILFGCLFATYATMTHSAAGGPGPRDLFDIGSAFIETLILLASSVTFGMAALAMKYQRGTGRLLFWLGVTLVLGLAFLGFEVHDFMAMFAKGGVPMRSGLLSAFFGLVPVHGLHVTAASLWLIAILGQIAVYGVDHDVKLGLLRLGLLWHFLDIVWIGIFTMVYLAGLT